VKKGEKEEEMIPSYMHRESGRVYVCLDLAKGGNRIGKHIISHMYSSHQKSQHIS
jgi:hypothetical protein